MPKGSISDEVETEIDQSDGCIEIIIAPQKEYHLTIDLGSVEQALGPLGEVAGRAGHLLLDTLEEEMQLSG